MERLGRCSLWHLVFVVMMIWLGGLTTAEATMVNSEESSEMVVSGGGGIFSPFQGQAGYSAVIQFMGAQSSQERLGVELEYRNYKADVFGANNVETQSYMIRGIGHYYFRSEGISPYIGLGLHLAINVIDEDDVERQRAINIKREIGVGYGILGLVGVEMPVGGNVAIFGEGRVSGDFQLHQIENQSGDNKLKFASLSGLVGIGGIRFNF